MKNKTQTLLMIVIVAVMIFSCKKKKDETPPPAQVTTTGSTPVHVNKLTAKINNSNWAMYCENDICASSISHYLGSYDFGGQTAFSNPYTSIHFNLTYTTGIVNLLNSGNFRGKYKDSTGTYFTSKTGTLNITTLDTAVTGGSIFKKFIATFSFNTDTIAGKSYQITNGVIDYLSSQ